jgi:hypothetical protein
MSLAQTTVLTGVSKGRQKLESVTAHGAADALVRRCSAPDEAGQCI